VDAVSEVTIDGKKVLFIKTQLGIDVTVPQDIGTGPKDVAAYSNGISPNTVTFTVIP